MDDPHQATSPLRASGPVMLVCMALLAGAVATPAAARSGAQIYREACAACHGEDGRGAPQERVGFGVPLPDFTDCSFATREPNVDWVAVAHEGGPVRAFSRLMPEFGEALTVAEIRKAMGHIRSFCPEDDWPRGELNLPRPLVTTKAFPEDEAVITSTISAEGPGAVVNELLWEKRFGARNQVEVALPFGWREQRGPEGDWESGIGDVVVGLKRAVYHSLEQGAIVSVMGELSLPTGNDEDGFGSDTAIFEGAVAYGQILPRSFFLHTQAGFALPHDGAKAHEEVFARAALGRSFTKGRWGRVWSPMVEVLGAKEIDAGTRVHWDLVPQMQVTLSTRQHVMLNAGVRIPLDEDEPRDTQVLVYLLWDWFDGGLFEGW